MDIHQKDVFTGMTDLGTQEAVAPLTKGQQELADREIVVLIARRDKFANRLIAAIADGNRMRVEGLKNNIAAIDSQITRYIASYKVLHSIAD